MKKDIVFTLPAEALEGATEAVLLGDFNNWTPGTEFELRSHQDGSFRTIVQLEEGETYHYRFLLNNGRWVNDYNAQQYTPVAGLYIDNCVITVSESNNSEAPQKPEPENKKSAVKAKAPKAAAPKAEETTAKKAAPVKAVATKTAKAKPADEKGKAKKAEKKKA
ncbi:MAG: isoamylase early set domain-containing protein [Bacteroidota bacterium]|nr:isoamylase early set domain-containing protein [Bacteroidota bacterium]